ncbi:MAG: response regulator [Proteobacteria bacterium]|nr:response regulator [Pseudomonadota bacterium]
MEKERLSVHKRIIFWMLVPVMIVGIVVSGGLIKYLSTPMNSFLAQQFNSNLRLISDLGLRICEGNFNDLLNLRLEDNLEMNKSMQRQALEEIKALSRQLPPIETIVLDKEGQVLISSQATEQRKFEKLPGFGEADIILALTVNDSPVLAHARSFPFWDWVIVSYILESDYQKPITTANTIVYLSTFSVFVSVFITLVFVFHKLVNRPLNRLIKATENVIDGNLEKVEKFETNELGRLTSTFNNMVESLEYEKAEVRHLLEEWQQSEYKFRSLFENTPIGICVLEEDGKILEANESMRSILGYSNGELQQQPVEELLLKIDESNQIEKGLKSDSTISYHETTLRKKDHSICQVRITITQFVLNEKNTYIAMVEDVSGQKKLEKRLQQAQKLEAVGTLAGGVAHDLNNILSGLVSYPELLLMKLPEDSPLKKPITTIQKSGLKAAAIVQDLLTLARRNVDTKEVINLNNIIREYLVSPEFEELKLHHPKVVIETSLVSDLSNVSGSTVHLTKAIMNLISNGAEAIGDQGAVKISTKNVSVNEALDEFEYIIPGQYVLVTVSDTGVGLSEQDMEKIFEPFYTKKEMGRSGTGLGMTVVWGTVKDHEGYINVTSDLGKGTEFSLYLPASSALLADVQQRNDIQDYAGEGESVLVVDDISDQRDLIEEILQELNYQVATAASGEEALEKIKNESFDLVILDMIMDPGIDGLETYQKILNLYPNQKAIIASGYSETDRVQEALELGVGQYLKKPFTMEELGSAVLRELKL